MLTCHFATTCSSELIRIGNVKKKEIEVYTLSKPTLARVDSRWMIQKRKEVKPA
jgi:hypothetical protein